MDTKFIYCSYNSIESFFATLEHENQIAIKNYLKAKANFRALFLSIISCRHNNEILKLFYQRCPHPEIAALFIQQLMTENLCQLRESLEIYHENQHSIKDFQQLFYSSEMLKFKKKDFQEFVDFLAYKIAIPKALDIII